MLPPGRIRDSDLIQQFQHPFLQCPALETDMLPQDFRNLLTGSQYRVERGHRLLEDHGDTIAADSAHLHLGFLQQILAMKFDSAGNHSATRWHQLHDRQRRHRFAATGLAEDGKGFTTLYLEADAVHSADGTLAITKPDLEVIYL